MQFSHIKIENWRQFAQIRINFHPRLTILTGTNGAGKTTILNMLSRSLGWQVSLMSLSDNEYTGVRSSMPDITLPFNYSQQSNGSIGLRNGQELNLGIDRTGKMVINYAPLKGADGVYITSHRQLFSYSAVKSIGNCILELASHDSTPPSRHSGRGSARNH